MPYNKNYVNGISVLICCYNSEQRLPRTISALAEQLRPDIAEFAIEVLVVDNASKDKTYATAKSLLEDPDFPYNGRVLYEQKPGKSHALERGLQEAQYKYIAIVDDDNWLAPDYLLLANALMEANPKIGVLGGVGAPVCEVVPPSWFSRFAIDYAADRQADYSGDITSEPGFLYGAGSVIRRAAWEQVREAGFHSLLTGRYGNNLNSGEDNELCYVLALAGYRIWYDERLKFQHFIPAQRLNWNYVRRLYKGNAASEVSLRPYRHFMQRTDVPVLPWIRNGLYAGRFALKASWRAIRQKQFFPREGNREFLLAAFYWHEVWLYFNKAWKQDPKFIQVQQLTTRLNTSSHRA
ncbi:glycosyltransferase [Hymenobacter nivis]|uniref:Glycosyltransferase n=1 Tax=Hymenobacter nivis TaxID=1850093 RepID=A0A502HG74_9BACT|nr:glycosyltransferase [Hymenobacter nivis]TPG72258.1 glycosyltransferase [Hymenobacter nivis]